LAQIPTRNRSAEQAVVDAFQLEVIVYLLPGLAGLGKYEWFVSQLVCETFLESSVLYFEAISVVVAATSIREIVVDAAAEHVPGRLE